MTRSTLSETLRKRQQCHDLRAAGQSQRQIQEALDVGRATVCDWLSRPRPTDEEVAVLPAIKADVTGQVGFKSRFDPELFSELRAESERQGAPINKVLGCSVRLYLDCMNRARSGGGEPVNVMGWRG